MTQRKAYRAADYQYPQEMIQEVMRRWSQYAVTFGYDLGDGQPVACGSSMLRSPA